MARADLAGAAHLELVDGVVQLRPEDAMVEAMLRGWRAQQTARGLREDTIEPRERLVRRFVAFTNEYPWQWGPGHVDEWTLSLTAEQHLAPSTIRGYQTDLRLFSEYLSDARYGWAAACEEQFGPGVHPVPICHEWNTIAHLNDYEGSPEARPFTPRGAAAVPRLRRRPGRAGGAGETQGRAGRLPGRHAVQGDLRVGAAAHRDRRSWMLSTGAGTRRRRSSAGSGCCTSATARRCAGSRRGGATCRR